MLVFVVTILMKRMHNGDLPGCGGTAGSGISFYCTFRGSDNWTFRRGSLNEITNRC